MSGRDEFPVEEKTTQKEPAGRVVVCASCGKSGTLRNSPSGMLCEQCLGVPRKLKKVVCRCGKVLLEEQEDGGNVISGSVFSKGGKLKVKCSCGKAYRLRGGKI